MKSQTCRLFHLWDKWSKPFTVHFTKSYYPWFDRDFELDKVYQQRTCLRCGKEEKQEIKYI